MTSFVWEIPRAWRRARTAAIWAATAATVLMGASACRRTADGVSTLTILSGSDEHALSLAFDLPEKFLVFLPLVARDSTGALHGVLATRWTHSPDYRSWTIHLRHDVRWQDGAPFTAHDVKFTLDLMADSTVLWATPGAYAVAVLDDTTYTITYRNAGPGTPLDDWTVYYPRHLLERLDPAKSDHWAFWLHPIGNGPYRHVRTVAKTAMEFEANPDYFGQPTRIQRIVVRFGSPMLTELQSGTVDVMQPDATDLPRVAADRRFRVYYTFNFANAYVIGWNQRRPPFDDVRVRRAMTYALDRRELHRLLNMPESTPVYDGPPTERQVRTHQLLEPIPFDPAEARRLLDAAGWQAGAGDGPRQRAGQPLRITALVSTAFGVDRVAVYVQEQLRRVGVEITIDQEAISVISRRVRAHDFDAAFLLRTIIGRSATDFFGPGSRLGYESPRAAAIVERMASSLDPDSVDAAHRELALLFRQDVPMTFLAPAVSFTLARAEVRGLRSPYQADPFLRAGALWLETKR